MPTPEPHRIPAPRAIDEAGASRRIVVVRAAAAIAWAVALVVAVGGDMPSTDSGVSFSVAALLTTYPLIDVIASLVTASSGGPGRGAARTSAAISALAALAVGAAAFGSDAGATLACFGAWAAISGAIQFGVAVRGRRAGRSQIPMFISGGLSTLAGLSFIAASGKDEANLATLGGYMAFGAVLYLASAGLRRMTPAPLAR